VNTLINDGINAAGAGSKSTSQMFRIIYNNKRDAVNKLVACRKDEINMNPHTPEFIRKRDFLKENLQKFKEKSPSRQQGTEFEQKRKVN
jgi:hypothetical protein